MPITSQIFSGELIEFQENPSQSFSDADFLYMKAPDRADWSEDGTFTEVDCALLAEMEPGFERQVELERGYISTREPLVIPAQIGRSGLPMRLILSASYTDNIEIFAVRSEQSNQVEDAVSTRIIFADNSSTLYDAREVFQARSFTVPGGTMGANSRLDISAQVYSEQGKNTRVRLLFGGVEIASFATKFGRSYVASRSVRNRGVLDSQITNSWGGNVGEASDVYGQFQSMTINTSDDVDIVLEIDNSGGNNRRCRVENFEVILWP